MGKLRRIISRVLLSVLIVLATVYTYLWVWDIFVKPLTPDETRFGITFSDIYAEKLGLNWKETYLAILDDLGTKHLRLPAYWSEAEPEEDVFEFDRLDFQVDEAVKRNVDIILAVGERLPRWPECHIPDWANDSPDRDVELLDYIRETVNRYKDVDNIIYWQVENEPFLRGFGDCPPMDSGLLDREIALVRSLDSRPVLITDSGELGDWIRAKRRADVFGTTMYRDVWLKRTIRFRYPLPPTWFKFKDTVTRFLAGQSPVQKIIVVEMQAEAWGKDPIPYISLEKQLKAMDFDSFKENIEYAERARIPDIYLWGAEWWYRLKLKDGHPEYWDYAKGLF